MPGRPMTEEQKRKKREREREQFQSLSFSLILQPVRINKPGAPLLGLAKSIYYLIRLSLTYLLTYMR